MAIWQWLTRRVWFIGAGVVCAALAATVGLVLAAAERSREAAARVSCNLGSVAVALACYEERHGHLPPAALTDPSGAPLLSWRVLILPYMDEQPLFEEFRLDEPWDSPHNRALLPRMPRPYAAPGYTRPVLPPHHTVLNVFAGEGTPFEPGRKNRFPARGTVLFVEAGEPVAWTKPNALPCDPGRPLPPLPGLFRDGFRSYVAGESYRFIRKGTPEADLRRMLTRAGAPDSP